MQKIRPFFLSLAHALAVLVYIIGVSLMMRSGEKLFGKVENSPLGPVVFLLLFVVSAAITSSLVFGRSVLWYLDGRKAEALWILFYIIGWLFIFIVFALSAQAIIFFSIK